MRPLEGIRGYVDFVNSTFSYFVILHPEVSRISELQFPKTVRVLDTVWNGTVQILNILLDIQYIVFNATCTGPNNLYAKYYRSSDLLLSIYNHYFVHYLLLYEYSELRQCRKLHSKVILGIC